MAWITRREYLSSRAGEVSRSVLPGKTGGQRLGAAWRITRRTVSLLTRAPQAARTLLAPSSLRNALRARIRAVSCRLRTCQRSAGKRDSINTFWGQRGFTQSNL